MSNIYRNILILCLSLLTALLVVSCANKGVGPQGGPKDTIPPVIKQEIPVNRTVNFTGTEIVLQCNEYLQVKDVANQVLISPPMRRTPTVKALGKKIIVTFEEPLRDSTTYMIDFGKAICDLNEGNPIDGYSYAFSTGPVIDTLELSGVLIRAEDLNPVEGMMVGLHSDLRDSAFLTETFVSIARTDENGAFTFRNVSPGRYHVYALNDVSKDYVYQPGEGLAFLDTVFSPVAIDTMVLELRPRRDTTRVDSVGALSADSLGAAILRDTISANKVDSGCLEFFPTDDRSAEASSWQPLSGSSLASVEPLLGDSQRRDSLAPVGEGDKGVGAVDSVWIKHTRYLPDDIVLRYFTEDKRKLYFVRCLREEAHKFTLLFAAPQDSMPVFDLSTPGSVPFDYVQTAAGFDTITVWLRDSSYIRQDTIEFGMTYKQTDSVYNIRTVTDTIRAIYRAPKLSQAQIEAQAKAAEKAAKIAAAKAAKGEKEKTEFITFKHNATASFEIYDSLRLTFPLPMFSWPGHVAAPNPAPGSLFEVPSEALLHPKGARATADSIPADSLSANNELITIDSNSDLSVVSASLVGDSVQRPALHLYKIVAPTATSLAPVGERGEGLGAPDTVLVPVSLRPSDTCASRFVVDADWECGDTYNLLIDSTAFVSIYGLHTDRTQIQLKVKPVEEYSTAIIRIEPFCEHMMIQILDAKEKVVRTLRADTAGARFEYLKPESYYVRLYEDLDGDSLWTTGDWLHHVQPEPVYYFDRKLTLKANWDFEETVLWRERSILEQKPTEIRKAVNEGKKK